NQTPLGVMRASARREIYLRAVYRVYLADRVIVSMTNQSSSGFGGDAGAAPGAPDISRSSSVAETYDKNLASLNKNLAGAIPGGSVRMLQASSRSVGISETFPRPLVIGYLAFDFPVSPEGEIGEPTSTRSVLNGRVRPFEKTLRTYFKTT